MRDDGASLALTVLRLMGWAPPAPVAELADPVDPPREEEPVRDNEGATQGTITYVRTPDRLTWPVPDAAWQDREARVVARVASLTAEGASPWDAAFRVFGGAPVTRGATGTGPYATQGREPPASVPR